MARHPDKVRPGNGQTVGKYAGEIALSAVLLGTVPSRTRYI